MSHQKISQTVWCDFCQQLHDQWPVERWAGVGVVVGCSGGADSVALLLALESLRRRLPDEQRLGFLVASHFNHRTRGTESDRDEAFVRQLASELKVEFVSDASPDSATKDEDSLRAMRLSFLQRTAERFGARYVALAHSSNDIVETVLHNLFRGTGPTGLAGILPHRTLGKDLVLMRPMLHMNREAIREGLRSIGQTWCEDSSNSNCDYRRNWIRHELLPQIESVYPNAETSIERAARVLRDWSSVMDASAAAWLEDHCVSGDELLRDAETESCVVILALQHFWQRKQWPRVDMTQSHWRRLYESIAGTTFDTYELPGKVRVQSRGNAVFLSR